MNRSFLKRLAYITGLAALIAASLPVIALAEDEAAEAVPALYGTAWAILPPLLAIVLALVTKEVYSSLFLGVLVGSVLYSGANFTKAFNHLLNDGIISSLANAGNVGIIVFLVILGALVSMMNKTGGSAAFGHWAKTKIKTRKGALLSTIVLGILIFVDDYFNCLTVGSVMKPLTDEHKISRAKLAYLIDATAAPVCIIAPISSWAAAVSGYVEGANGFTLFIKAIPYNYYALFTIAMMIMLVNMKFDYGKMAAFERNAIEKGDLFTVKDKSTIESERVENELNGENGKVLDLVLPVVLLIVSCVIAMLYSGGFFSGVSFVDAFADCDATVALPMGSLVSFVITIIYYCLRKVISFNGCMNCLPDGFKAMVAPILILTLAWSLKAMTDSLGLGDFVEKTTKGMPSSIAVLLPFVLFLIACVIATASGTSWGTFGILIPVGLEITKNMPELTIPVMAACMAGAVCGDHCSPISDTTIMASAGAACDHVSHVSTQLPYVITVASVSAVSYLICCLPIPVIGGNPWFPLVLGLVILYAVLRVIRKKSGTYISE